MFDIRIGTLIPAEHALSMIPQLNPHGFESYQLNFRPEFVHTVDLQKFGKQISELLGDRPVCFGIYGNTLQNEILRSALEKLIRFAPQMNCTVIGLFAGSNPQKSVPDTIPEFKAIFDPLCKLSEENGVRLALEGCGNNWNGPFQNIAYGPAAWELIFNAVTSDALTLEWEPCHALEHLAKPIPQLRRWAGKVSHVHGKDATIAWDVIDEYGIDSGKPYLWNRTPGFGDTNWADVFTVLLQAGFTGCCNIEGYHDPVHYDDLEWSAQLTALQHLKNCRGGQTFFPGPEEYRGYQPPRRPR